MEQQTTTKSIFKASGKFGAKGVGYFALTLFLFGVINTILFVAGLFMFKRANMADGYAMPLILLVVIGILFLVLAMYVTYKYLIIEGLYVVYQQLNPFFRKMCAKIIEKKSVSENVGKAVDIDAILSDVYGRSVPSIVRKGINFIINRIPFASMLLDIKDVLVTGTKEEAEDALYQKVDAYIKSSIFECNSNKWVYIFLIINAIIQSGLILYFVK